MAERFSISDLAAEFGVTTRSIRFYEDEGLLAPIRAGQRRIYRPRERIRLRLILRGKRLGFSLAEIREILDLYDAPPGEAGQLQHLLAKIDGRRRELLQKRQDIEATLEELHRLDRQCATRLEEIDAGADAGERRIRVPALRGRAVG